MASVDPFTSMGGGVQTPTGQWLPKTHPNAKQYLPAAGVPGAAPAAAATTIPGQAAAASTYSATPAGAPTNATGNQGTQDVLRNTLLNRATQSTTVDRNDPNFRQQADAFAAASERARRNTIADQAESFTTQNLGGSGAQDVRARMANESAQQQQGQFEAQLVSRELQNKRDEIREALSSMQGLLSDDQKNALQRELAELDAQLRRAAIASSEKLGFADIGLRRDGLRQNNDQFNKTLGFNIGTTEAEMNQRAMQMLLGS